MDTFTAVLLICSGLSLFALAVYLRKVLGL